MEALKGHQERRGKSKPQENRREGRNREGEGQQASAKTRRCERVGGRTELRTGNTQMTQQIRPRRKGSEDRTPNGARREGMGKGCEERRTAGKRPDKEKRRAGTRERAHERREDGHEQGRTNRKERKINAKRSQGRRIHRTERHPPMHAERGRREPSRQSLPLLA